MTMFRSPSFNLNFRHKGCIAFFLLFLARFYWIIPTNRTFEYLRSHFLDPFEKAPLVILRTHLRLLTSFEYFLLALVLFSMAYLVYLEIKHKYLSGLCEEIRKDSKFSLMATLYLVSLSAAPYLSPGMPDRNDSIYHILPAWSIYQSFLEVKFSLFTNSIWCGYPYAESYGPFFSVATAFLGWILKDWLLALKLLLCAFHIGSGLAMYLYVYHRTRNRVAALISALAYCFIYFRFHWLINMGRLRYGIHLFAFPLIWYLADQYLAKPRRKKIILLGFLFSILTLTQPGPNTIFTFLFFSLYALEEIGFSKETFARKIGAFIGLNTSYLIMIALAGWLVVPNMVMNPELRHLLSINETRLAAPSLMTLLTWTPVPHQNHYGSYLGLTLVFLACLGIMRALLKKNRWALTISFLCLGTFFMVFGKDIPGYSWIPWIYAQNSPGYYLLFSIFFISVLCGYGYLFFERQNSKKNLAALGVILFILLDLSPLTFQDSFSDTSLHGRAKVYEWLRMKESRNARVVDIADELAFQAVFIPIYTGFPSLNGPDLVGATSATRGTAHSVIYALQDKIFSQSERNADFLKKMLFLTNVEYVIARHELSERLFSNIFRFENDLKIGQLQSAAIALASKKIEPLKSPLAFTGVAQIREALEASGIEKDQKIMGKILLDSRSESESEEIPARSPTLAFQIINSKIKQSEVEIEYSLSQEAFLHIATAYYPYLKITIDGRRISPVYKTAFGFLALKSPGGVHQLKIEPTLTFLSQIMISVALFVLLFCILLICRDFADRKYHSV